MLGINTIGKKIFGSSNDRYVKSLEPIVRSINELEAQYENFSDADLKENTAKFRQRLVDGETLDQILPEAFANVREAAKRTLGQRHFDVQLMGGIVLHRGMIAEMKTGEGKTLVSTLPTYLNALTGDGVHVVTVNDYLASRDSEWMGQVHNFLGLTVGCVTGGMTPEERKVAYAADITYGTNNEFGFDYLRDNMRFTLDEMVQRKFNFAIIDEVDSILIDEARTPLIISGPVEDSTEQYITVNKILTQIVPEDYELDEKAKSVSFTEEGTSHLEELLKGAGIIEPESDLYDISNVAVVHHANQALRAHAIFEKDRDYIVNDRKVVIIDEFTGRMMEGRRFSEGLHQALEAKEGVPIQNENQTLASITFQNYFRMYPKLAGMTGTAMTEASEFSDIYKLEAVEMPTNVPISREDVDDDIFRTAEEKYAAISAMIKERHAKQQPMLVGTTSIEKSEYLSKLLKKDKIPHHVLNARYHEQEAEIVAQAGRPGAVTIATNMAGRGTDIQLGGNLEQMLGSAKDDKQKQKITEQHAKDKQTVLDAGGLCVIGTERHESRRIDNQLRGRSGRQGDPGFSKFFLSTEDDLIRIFGADKKMDWVLGKMGEPGVPITHPLITKLMEKSQKKVEERHYEARKNLLKFDDVMNDQRTIIYDQRYELMEGDDIYETRHDMALDLIDMLVGSYIPPKSFAEEWNVESLQHDVQRIFGLELSLEDWAKEEGMDEEELQRRLTREVEKLFQEKEDHFGTAIVRDVEKKLLLYTLDELWKDHLLSLDHLRQGIYLRAYGQKDPLNEYKREAFMAFEDMLAKLRETFLTRWCHMEIHKDGGDVSVFDRRAQRMQESRMDPAAAEAAEQEATQPQEQRVVRQAAERDPNDPSTWGRVGRNEPCPCGSGKKFKQCHGKIG